MNNLKREPRVKVNVHVKLDQSERLKRDVYDSLVVNKPEVADEFQSRVAAVTDFEELFEVIGAFTEIKAD